jgi:glycosyltransferase involved in cell wall biosynthesis
VQVVRMMWFITRYIRAYDGVLTLQNPWTVVRAGWWWKLWRKRVGLWYSRGETYIALALARPFLDFIFTPTTHGYHGGGDIKQIVGYGVDPLRFKPLRRPKHDGVFKIITVGAIEPSKDYDTLLHAMSIITESVDKPCTLTIVGSPKTGEEPFAGEVRKTAHGFGLGEVVTFAGPMKNIDIATLHEHADLYVSVNTLPSIEKSLVEAALSGLPILTSNHSFEEFARDYGTFVFFEKKNAAALAERIRHMMLMSYDARHALGQVFRKVAADRYSIGALARGIISAYRRS